MEEYASQEEYFRILQDRSRLPAGFSAASVPVSFFPVERSSEKPYAMNLSLISLGAEGGTAAGVFTSNSFPGAPVIISRERIGSSSVRGILINNKIANVCAPDGRQDAEDVLGELERLAGGGVFLPASTGIIGWRLPVREMKATLPLLLSGLQGDSILPVARGIMTTDSFPKVRSAPVGDGRIVAVAKGAGMIEPNMATMLVFVLTDVTLPVGDLQRACRETAGETFNTITVDSDQSTSDMMILLSSRNRSPVSYGDFADALFGICRSLAEDIVRNGEGTAHVIRVRISGAPDKQCARGIAKSVANSPLVKTAVYGSDPNLGRIIMAVGKYAGNNGIPLNTEKVSVSLGGREVFRTGCFHLDNACEKELTDYLRAAALPEKGPGYPVHDRVVEISIDLGLGREEAGALGSDLSYQYIRENADYRT